MNNDYTLSDTLTTADPVTAKPAAESQTQSVKIIEAVQPHAKFWHDPTGKGYASLTTKDVGTLHILIKSDGFELHLRQIYGEAYPVIGRHGSLPGIASNNALKEAISTMQMLARRGETRQPAVRVAKTDDTVWVDLGTKDGRAVRINAAGVEVVDQAEVPFVRPNSLQPLPIPSHDPNALAKLRKLLSFSTETDFQVAVAWMIGVLMCLGPCPLLVLTGEQGAGKSVRARILQQCVDPSSVELRTLPRTEEDLLIAAKNCRVLALDNLSSIPQGIADAMCRLITGVGMGKRRLFSDSDEELLSVRRPMLVTAIENPVRRGDLADRAIRINVLPIEDQRIDEELIWERFDSSAPGILALLLDGVKTALQRLPNLQLPRLPRMADFTRCACAAAPTFGWTEEEMLTALIANRADAVADVVETDALATAIRDLADQAAPQPVVATAGELLTKLNAIVPDDIRNDRSWPRNHMALSSRLTRIAGPLRRAGTDIRRDSRRPGTGDRLITILKRSERTSEPVRRLRVTWKDRPFRLTPQNRPPKQPSQLSQPSLRDGDDSD